jgi:nicotinamide-nucleotide amidase
MTMTNRSSGDTTTRNIRPGTAKQKGVRRVSGRKPEVSALALARRLGRVLAARGWMCACAESCTGGQLSQTITAIPGSSAWFERGFVTYSNRSKAELLGVPERVIARYGAVSEETARAMAEGALRASAVQLRVAITGIAGPGGGRPGRPVGTVFLAYARAGGDTETERRRFRGGRHAVRRSAVLAALAGLCARVRD